MTESRTSEQKSEHSRADSSVAAARASGNRARRRSTAPAAQNRVAFSRKCQSIAKSGKPCTANATARSNFTACPFHEDIPDEVKQAWRARGHAAIAGAMTVPDAPDPALSNPEDITRFVQEISGRLLRGEITASTAVALTSLAGAALRAYEANLGKRLAELEALAAERAVPIVGAVRVLPAAPREDPADG